jgi:hypothetical protein
MKIVAHEADCPALCHEYVDTCTEDGHGSHACACRGKAWLREHAASMRNYADAYEKTGRGATTEQAITGVCRFLRDGADCLDAALQPFRGEK